MSTTKNFKVTDSTADVNLGKTFYLQDVETLKVVNIPILSEDTLKVKYYAIGKLQLQNTHVTYRCVEI